MERSDLPLASIKQILNDLALIADGDQMLIYNQWPVELKVKEQTKI